MWFDKGEGKKSKVSEDYKYSKQLSDSGVAFKKAASLF